MSQSLDEFITRSWYSKAWWLYVLFPLSLLYRAILTLRRFSYKKGISEVYRASKPVIVVGNLTVGGTGKSPLVAYLVHELRNRGLRPGIVSRGYGAAIPASEVREVFANSPAHEVGDEPLMLKRRLGCPVFVSPSRRLALQALEQTNCDVIISDDGMQHYAMARDIEICVFDAQRLWGNGSLLPMGPLREPLKRLQSIPFVVLNGNGSRVSGSRSALLSVSGKSYQMLLEVDTVTSLDSGQEQALSAFKGQVVHAVAAIGNPERFFTTLEQAGLSIIRHAFPDHHAFRQADFGFSEAQDQTKAGQPACIIMTEKDAVKCQSLDLQNAWYLPVNARLDNDLAGAIIETLQQSYSMNLTLDQQ